MLESRHPMKRLWAPWRRNYIEGGKQGGCIFCEALKQADGPENLIAFRGSQAFVILNRYPYASGHLMVVPVEHKSDLEQLSASARAEMMELAARSSAVLRVIYHPEGLNLGANIGEAAGAGVKEHVHLHLVPRWIGDTNFMPVLSQTRVLPEALEDTYRRVREAFQN